MYCLTLQAQEAPQQKHTHETIAKGVHCIYLGANFVPLAMIAQAR